MSKQKTLFSTAEAADYIAEQTGKSFGVSNMKYHVHVADPPNLTGQLVGNSLVFTKAELDNFIKNKRPQGRPVKATEE